MAVFYSVISALVVILTSTTGESQSSTYYIKPTHSNHCPTNNQQCLTLSQFAENHFNMHRHSVNLILLTGNHSLVTNLSLSNLSSLRITSQFDVTILCQSSSHIMLQFIEQIHVRGLRMVACGNNLVKNTNSFLIQNTIFEGGTDSGTALILINTTTEIVSCNFLHNQFGTMMPVKSPKLLTTEVTWFIYRNISDILRVGGAIISSHSIVNITHSSFENNTAQVGGDIFTEQHSIISIINSTFIGEDSVTEINDINETPFGRAVFIHECDIFIQKCYFTDKHATVGAAITSSLSRLRIEGSVFHANSAVDHGGAVFAINSNISISGSYFEGNIAGGGGGVSTHQCLIDVDTSVFVNNTALRHAAALDLFKDVSTIQQCVFKHNIAYSFAGAILLWFCTTTMYGQGSISQDDESLSLNDHHAFGETFGFHFDNNITFNVKNCNTSMTSSSSGNIFINNKAPIGAAMYIINSKIKSFDSAVFSKNHATLYASVYILDSIGEFKGSTDMVGNLGSFFAFNSNITFSGCTTFVQCSPPKHTTANLREGGALSLALSTLTFYDKARLEYNYAEVGGAIFATESKIYLNDEISIVKNKASENGGGLYLSQSELNALSASYVNISGNRAFDKGGGLYAVSSSIICAVTGSKESENATELYTGALVQVVENAAQSGGGLYLEANSKVTLLKNYVFESHSYPSALNFIGNTAEYGGAVYVDDESNSGTCMNNPFELNSQKSECFIRVVSTQTILTANTNYSLKNILFDFNFATVSGPILFGGLLDRCTVSIFNEVDRTIDINDNQFLSYSGDGLQYLLDISKGTVNNSISSLPVQVCVCHSVYSDYNCSNKLQHRIEVKKGEFFNLSIIAVNQIREPVNATIQGYLHTTKSDLTKGQTTQIKDTSCANISFQIVSQSSSEQLTLFASDGPCKDADLSVLNVNVSFLPCTCPIGFEPSTIHSTTCVCQCHHKIGPHVAECNSNTQSFHRSENVWITFVNQTNSSGYIVYKYCPFDYCVPPNVSAPVNLNLENGTDIQCALNRTGTLCGACKSGLSLSLGSSKCLECPHYWPALFVIITIFAIVAGIGLVVLILWLNLTVAIGTINGLLFYAHIVSANKVVLLPYSEPNFITVFISWLNLELGIDVCYISGMDTFIKTWLLLAFPIYIILLVIVLIGVSKYSSRFSELIAKRNPVATLATLILISYGKLFHVILLAQPFSLATLSYPNGDKELLWLPDGTIKYLTGKHVALFITALLILAICIVYSLLLLFWQLILHCANWKIFRCFRNPNLYLFMEAYHIPYIPRHRYWTGLTLHARAILYLIAAANVSGNPQIQLISIIFVVSCIILLKMFIATKTYKKWLIDALESFFYINILLFASFTSFNLSTGELEKQDAIAYTSVGLSILVTLFIILYHISEYLSLFDFCKTKFLKNATKWYKPSSLQEQHDPIRNDSICRYDDIFGLSDIVSTSRKPTSSVVEINHPELPALKPTCSVVEITDSLPE